MTVIEQVRAGATAADNRAYAPGLIGDVTDTSRTLADADAGSARAATVTIMASQRTTT
jgi:hypothetical protein